MCICSLSILSRNENSNELVVLICLEIWRITLLRMLISVVCYICIHCFINLSCKDF